MAIRRKARWALQAIALLLAAGGCDKPAANGPSASPNTAADAAGDEQPACVDLTCLPGATFTYQPNREWQRSSAAAPSLPSDELAESDYRPLPNAPAILVEFSSDGMHVELTPTAGGDAVAGTRVVRRGERARFDLDLFAGGRFVVQPGATALDAEHTVYGSGVPIASSTRGVLLPER